MGALISWVIDFIEWITGRKARREDRDAYMAALTAVTQASLAQSQLLTSWLQSFTAAAQGPAQKGWTQSDREQAIDEILAERPALQARIPEAIKGDYHAIESWLGEELMQL